MIRDVAGWRTYGEEVGSDLRRTPHPKAQV